MNEPARGAALRLDVLPLKKTAVIDSIDWSILGDDGRRLRELGFAEGVQVEPLHRGFLGRDPLACRVGRMTVAIRRSQAAAILVRPVAS